MLSSWDTDHGDFFILCMPHQNEWLYMALVSFVLVGVPKSFPGHFDYFVGCTGNILVTVTKGVFFFFFLSK